MSTIFGSWSDWNFDFENPTDATTVADGGLVAPNIDVDSHLTVGSYRFTFSEPEKVVDLDKPLFDAVGVTDEYGNIIYKDYSIDRIEIDVVNNKSIVDITIYQNPIPLIVIYGAVFAVCSIIGAVSINSVLEKVETLPGGIIQSVDKSPFSWAILGLLFIVLAVPILQSR